MRPARPLLWILPAAALLAAAASTARAAKLRADCRWVETDVALAADGTARVTYRVRWRVIRGRMHGFYLQGIEDDAAFRPGECRALHGGRALPVDIRDMGVHDGKTKYDVLLSRGRSVPEGEVTFEVTYDTDLVDQRHVGLTDSEHGRLVYVNWGAARFDEGLEHYTVRLGLPVPAPEGEISFDDPLLRRLGLRTEKWMNRRYRIAYAGRPAGDGSRLEITFHREGLASEEPVRLQLYLAPGEAFQDLAEEVRAQSWADAGYRALGFLLLAAVAGAALALYLAKYRALSRARAEMKEVRWEDQPWTPPRIQVATHRKSGAIAKLSILEAAVFLDIPFRHVVGLMAYGLEQRGLLRLHALDPPRAERLEAGDEPLSPYEKLLLSSIDEEGRFERTVLLDLFHAISDAIGRKTWNADLEATRNYYRNLLEEKYFEVADEEDLERTAEAPRAGAFPLYLPFFLHASAAGGTRKPYFDRVDALGTGLESLSPEPVTGYASFLSSDACHSACYVHTACHDACHSACHAACHSACHSACHAACHSACVSGGAH